ncbi:alpha/beta hydrolase, partial [Streptomyces albidoflavus]
PRPAEILLSPANPAPDGVPTRGTHDEVPGRGETPVTYARLSRVRGAHHDVLNDAQHRSVAAEIVTFLEGLRDGMAPAVSVAASAW